MWFALAKAFIGSHCYSVPLVQECAKDKDASKDKATV